MTKISQYLFLNISQSNLVSSTNKSDRNNILCRGNIVESSVKISSILYLSVVDHEFEGWLGQTKDNKIGSGCFSTKNAVLMSKNTDWLSQNHGNVSE